MWGVCLYAFMRGGWAERTAAVAIIIAAYSTTIATLYFTSSTSRYRQIEISILLVDLAELLVLVYIVIRSEKFWPMWLTAMHSLAVLAHLSPYVPHMLPWGYWRAVAVWGYPMLIVLAFAIHQHHRQKSAGPRPRY